MPMHYRTQRRRFSDRTRFFLSVVLILTCWAPAFARSSRQASLNELRQFTARGHVLGFGVGSMVVGSLDHALTIAWVNAERIEPVADSAPGKADSPGDPKSQAQPLGRVTYAGLWPGVTVEYAASEKSVFKSTYRIQAGLTGAPVAHIRLKYSRPVRLDAEGSLVVKYERGEMKEAAPIAWQERGGGRFPVPVKYVIRDDREVGFDASYDPRYALVIDPDLVWNTFQGSSGADYANAVAVDANGNVYVTGHSGDSWGSPINPYNQFDDAFVAKFDNSGNLLWNTFMGGNSYDDGTGLAVDGSGNVYAVGYSPSTWGTPIRAFGGSYDGYVAKLDADGALLWSTFLGSAGYDDLNSIGMDTDGNVYVVGTCQGSWGTPVRAYTAAGNDACVAKLSGSGALLWNTFLGGTNDEYGWGIAVDGAGNVYATGESAATWGSPVRAYTGVGLADAFAAKLSGSTGTLVWNTFLGATTGDAGRAVAVDGSGNVFVTGYSQSTWGAPIIPHHGSYDAFAAKLGGNGVLLWNTFLGSAGLDQSYALAVDANGDAYVAGYSNAAWGSPIAAYNGSFDGMAAKIGANGTLLWNTFLGSADSEFFLGLALNTAGDLHVAGQGYATWGSPVNPHYGNGNFDILVAQISGDLIPPVSATPTATVTGTTTQTLTPTVTPTNPPTLTHTPTGTRTASATATVTATASISVTASVTPTLTPMLSVSETPDSSATPTPTPTTTASLTPTFTASATRSRTITATHTITPTQDLTQTVTPTVTATPTSSFTPHITRTGTNTATHTITLTRTITPTVVLTRTATLTATVSATLSRTPSVTPTWSFTTTSTATPTVTATGTFTHTGTITETATKSPTPTETSTSGPTSTVTPTPTITLTGTITPARTATSENLDGRVEVGERNVLAFPNPARNHVTLLMDLAETALVKARIYSASGEPVAVLSGQLPAGRAQGLVWDCRQTPPGVYIITLAVNGEEKGTTKVVIVK